MIPIIFSDKIQTAGTKYILAGDIGGTKVNLALFEMSKAGIRIVKADHYPSKEFGSLTDIIQDFLKTHKEASPSAGCFGVAGPVVNGVSAITNLPWFVSAEEISNVTSVSNVMLINDLEATAYGLACLQENDFRTIHEGTHNSGNIAILAPGTGLGEAGLFWDGKFYHPFATEGGHSDFSPRNGIGIELYEYLSAIHEPVSWEHIISGPGIFSIYKFLRDIKNYAEPAWLKEEIESEDPSAAISEAALTNKEAICAETMRLFIMYTARESSNLVLKMKATGGLFLGGGIPPKISTLFSSQAFIENYYDCDRLLELVKSVPIKIIMNDKAALFGAAYYAGYAA